MFGSFSVSAGWNRIGLVCAVLAVLVTIWSEAEGAVSITPRIIGGQEAQPDEWGFMAALRLYEKDKTGLVVVDVLLGEGDVQRYEARSIPGGVISTGIEGSLIDCGQGYASCPEAAGNICLVESTVHLTPERQAEMCWESGGIGVVVLANERGLVYDRFKRIRHPIMPVVFVAGWNDALALRNQVGGRARMEARTRLDSFCGGAYLGSGWVVTAAHCVDDARTRGEIDFAVDIGGGDLAEQGRQVFGVARILVHGDFRKLPPLENDVALIELDVIPEGVKPVRIADAALLNKLTRSKASAIAVGRGLRKRLPENSNDIDETWWTTKLFSTELILSSREECNGRFNAYLDAVQDDRSPRNPVGESMMCAGQLDGSSGPCYGDSGGPLLVRTGSRYALVGLTSWGVNCAHPGLDDVFTNVTYFSKDIQNAIWVGRIHSMALFLLYMFTPFR